MEWQPYIFFNGQAREALTFYKDCFGGEVEFKTFEGTPIANDVPEDYRSNILHSSLQIKGKTVLMASDAMSPKSEGAKFEGFSVSINFDSEEKCDQAFERISAGGKITAPLQLQFWGDKFGEVTDKFNVSWMIHYQPNSDPPSKKMKTNLTPITDNVLFNVIAREWRMKWSADESKASLSKIQEIVDAILPTIRQVEGVTNIQRVVCGGCHDYKLIISLSADMFVNLERAEIEAGFISSVTAVPGVTGVETQTYTLMTL